MRVLHMKSKEELEKMLKQKSNIIVKNLPESANGFEMDNLFSKYGKIISSKIGTDIEGNSLKYGYIQFEKEEEATECIQSHLKSPIKLNNEVL